MNGTNKNDKATPQKHRIDFADATKIFDGFIVERLSDQNHHGEKRMLTIGLLEGREVVVVYTIRGNEKRIITARRARKNEREIFWEKVECSQTG